MAKGPETRVSEPTEVSSRVPLALTVKHSTEVAAEPSASVLTVRRYLA